LCEGKTDEIYLKLALQYLPSFHAKLTKSTPKPMTNILRYFSYSATAHDVLQLGGGTGDLRFFIATYKSLVGRFKYAPMEHPIIVLIDNDSGAQPIFNVCKEQFGLALTLKSDDKFHHLTHNLYLIKTPAIGSGGDSYIENFFDSSLLATVVDGKKFNPAKEHGAAGEYGKVVFAEKVVRPNASTIDFSKFSSIFERVVAVLDHYKPPAAVALPITSKSS
jgi:RNA-directed DNA polymerase